MLPSPPILSEVDMVRLISGLLNTIVVLCITRRFNCVSVVNVLVISLKRSFIVMGIAGNQVYRIMSYIPVGIGDVICYLVSVPVAATVGASLRPRKYRKRTHYNV